MACTCCSRHRGDCGYASVSHPTIRKYSNTIRKFFSVFAHYYSKSVFDIRYSLFDKKFQIPPLGTRGGQIPRAGLVWLTVNRLIDRDPPVNRPTEAWAVNRPVQKVQSFFPVEAWTIFFLVPFAGLFSMADSWVWGHFTKPAKKGDKATCAIVGSNGKLCGAQIAYTSSTSSLAYHLTSVHGLERGTPSKKQKTLKWGHSIGTSPEFPLNERELLCVTWASNGFGLRFNWRRPISEVLWRLNTNWNGSPQNLHWNGYPGQQVLCHKWYYISLIRHFTECEWSVPRGLLGKTSPLLLMEAKFIINCKACL